MTDFQVLLDEPEPGILVLNLSGELDLSTTAAVREATTPAIDSGGYKTLVFDLTRLGFMDSSGLHVLVEAHQAMQARRGEVKVVCGSPNLRRVFELTGLEQVLNIVEPGPPVTSHPA